MPIYFWFLQYFFKNCFSFFSDNISNFSVLILFSAAENSGIIRERLEQEALETMERERSKQELEWRQTEIFQQQQLVSCNLKPIIWWRLNSKLDCKGSKKSKSNWPKHSSCKSSRATEETTRREEEIAALEERQAALFRAMQTIRWVETTCCRMQESKQRLQELVRDWLIVLSLRFEKNLDEKQFLSNSIVENLSWRNLATIHARFNLRQFPSIQGPTPPPTPLDPSTSSPIPPPEVQPQLVLRCRSFLPHSPDHQVRQWKVQLWPQSVDEGDSQGSNALAAQVRELRNQCAFLTITQRHNLNAELEAEMKWTRWLLWRPQFNVLNHRLSSSSALSTQHLSPAPPTAATTSH